jgi:hypothetical protein
VSLKENISMVKEELNAEEQFFEQAVKTERFVKKYKTPLIGLVVAVILAAVGTAGYNAYSASKRSEANAAYTTLTKDPGNAQAQKTLKSEAPGLYAAWQMDRALKSGDVKALQQLGSSAAPEVADVSAYEAAVKAQDMKALDAYAYRKNAFYKDLAIIDGAVLLIKAGKVQEAHQRLKLVDANSPVAPLAAALAHYGVK